MAGWRGFAPAMGEPKLVDLARAGVGAGLGLLLAGLALRALGIGWLIAPFGASAVLVYAVPNSPLAQPWSVVMGNTLSALVALAVITAFPAVDWAIPLAVGLAIATMIATRALHPPGGAVSLLVALAGKTDWLHTLGPVIAGSCLLVAIGILWNRAVGRVYPFRQPAQPGTHGTIDPKPEDRIGLDPAELATILEDFRQSSNVGVADLARLVGAAEQAAAARRMEGFAASDIMSRDLVTVGPEAPLAHVADIFRKRGFTSLPVVGEADHLLGLIFQIDLIRRAREDAFRQHHSLIRALAHLIDSHRKRPPKAAEIMETNTPRIAPDTPVGAIMPLLADGGAEAVAVVEGPKVVGIVTRTDLVSALSQRLALVQMAS